MIPKYWLLFPILLTSFLSGVEEIQSINNGEDLLQPISRFDLRIKYQTGANAPNCKDWIYTARVEKVLDLPNNWQMSLRADLPYETFTCRTCKHQSFIKNCKHMGDSLAQLFLIPPPMGNWMVGYGLKVIFPTGGDNLQIGDGKYQLLPSFGFRYNLDHWSQGAYSGILVRHAFAIGGFKTKPNALNQTYIQPFFNINLVDQWFINSSPEMIYNWESGTWFIPFDIMIGKMITPKIVISLEYEAAIVYDFPQYRQQVEFRLGFFF